MNNPGIGMNMGMQYDGRQIQTCILSPPIANDETAVVSNARRSKTHGIDNETIGFIRTFLGSKQGRNASNAQVLGYLIDKHEVYSYVAEQIGNVRKSLRWG